MRGAAMSVAASFACISAWRRSLRIGLLASSRRAAPSVNELRYSANVHQTTESVKIFWTAIAQRPWHRREAARGAVPARTLRGCDRLYTGGTLDR
jgi:hypothetical protein